MPTLEMSSIAERMRNGSSKNLNSINVLLESMVTLANIKNRSTTLLSSKSILNNSTSASSAIFVYKRKLVCLKSKSFILKCNWTSIWKEEILMTLVMSYLCILFVAFAKFISLIKISLRGIWISSTLFATFVAHSTDIHTIRITMGYKPITKFHIIFAQIWHAWPKNLSLLELPKN